MSGEQGAAQEQDNSGSKVAAMKALWGQIQEEETKKKFNPPASTSKDDASPHSRLEAERKAEEQRQKEMKELRESGQASNASRSADQRHFASVEGLSVSPVAAVLREKRAEDMSKDLEKESQLKRVLSTSEHTTVSLLALCFAFQTGIPLILQQESAFRESPTASPLPKRLQEESSSASSSSKLSSDVAIL